MDSFPHKIEISADGARLTGTWSPAAGSARANLVLHGATGVPQRFYRHFTSWANAQGLGVLTYDYRDFGESAFRPLRESDTTFADWAVRDQAAAQAALADLAPEGPLWVLGHSLGGLGIPFHGYPDRVEKIVAVGAGIGHFTDHPWSYRPKVLAFWFLLGPVATALAGYMPGKRLLLGADLPAGVYWQWRKWCTRRDFFDSDIGVSLPAPNYALKGPEIRICVASDDVVVPPVAVKRYAQALAPSGASFRAFAPADYGLSTLGHIEFLARDREPVWGGAPRAQRRDRPMPLKEPDQTVVATRMTSRARRVIFWANITMIAMIVIHDGDHVRQASNWCYTISAQLWLVNVSVYIPSLIALALLWRGRGAAGATMINGLLVGAAFSEVHLWRPSIPVWGIWNDNFFILGVDRLSWAILALTVLVGALVSAAGAYALGLQWAARRSF